MGSDADSDTPLVRQRKALGVRNGTSSTTARHNVAHGPAPVDHAMHRSVEAHSGQIALDGSYARARRASHKWHGCRQAINGRAQYLYEMVNFSLNRQREWAWCKSDRQPERTDKEHGNNKKS